MSPLRAMLRYAKRSAFCFCFGHFAPASHLEQTVCSLPKRAQKPEHTRFDYTVFSVYMSIKKRLSALVRDPFWSKSRNSICNKALQNLPGSGSPDYPHCCPFYYFLRVHPTQFIAFSFSVYNFSDRNIINHHITPDS